MNLRVSSIKCELGAQLRYANDTLTRWQGQTIICRDKTIVSGMSDNVEIGYISQKRRHSQLISVDVNSTICGVTGGCSQISRGCLEEVCKQLGLAILCS